MASLEFQPVPPGTSAWEHRGATFYVRLLGAAASSFRETFADVAVPDPHDADVKVVELSVLEFVVLRALLRRVHLRRPHLVHRDLGLLVL